ncbi:MmpS family transport accessory protein [Saccharothrix xinjiangensis]|uniref:MmpS family transport accessory protein n=1 Tax=Saccharothrix xinjiangensis TaxID=204798 RepID=A0ABV9Y5E3_9PSEU
MTEPDPPEHRAARWFVIAGCAVLVAGAAVFALRAATPAPPVQVVYDVTGTAERATVTYSAEDGGTRREELASFPWHRELTLPAEAERRVLTVTIGPAGGDVACQVAVDGVERRSATATGARTSALCDGF